MLKFYQMMKNLSSLGALVVFLLLSAALPVKAAEPGIVINEIAWMGTASSANDEWIELYNNAGYSFVLENWVLKTVDGSPKIDLAGTIPANGFYLLERTDDNTLPTLSADQIYTGALNNNGEKLELYDNFGNLIDDIDCGSGWFAGENFNKKTMERKNSLLAGNVDNWENSQNPGGTPKTKNSAAAIAPPIQEPAVEPEPKIEVEPELLPPEDPQAESNLKEPQLTAIYPSGIFISEILPSPEGADEEDEWIEIVNENDFEVVLFNWQIADVAGSAKAYTFPQETLIKPKGFLVLSRPLTKITLNNDADGLKIFQPDKKISDAMLYEKAPRGQSYNRTVSGWRWSDSLTPGRANIISAPQSAQLESKEKSEIESQETEKFKAESGLAAVGKNISKTSGSLFIFLIALFAAICFGIIILILKKRMKIS